MACRRNTVLSVLSGYIYENWTCEQVMGWASFINEKGHSWMLRNSMCTRLNVKYQGDRS